MVPFKPYLKDLLNYLDILFNDLANLEARYNYYLPHYLCKIEPYVLLHLEDGLQHRLSFLIISSYLEDSI